MHRKVPLVYWYRGIIFLSSLFIVGSLWRTPFIVLLVLSTFFVEMNRTFKWRFLKTSLISAALGLIAEIIAIAFNAWQYTEPQIFGITFWLIPLWGIAALFFLALSELIGELKSSQV